MHKTFLISYDLKRPGQSYADLYEAIKRVGDSRHILESVWLVKVDDATMARDVYRAIRPHIIDTERLFIIEVTDQDRQGWLGKSVWAWLREE